jgi:hypothetical protein
MQDKYELFTGDPPRKIYKSLMDNIPASPIASWYIKSQICQIVSDPNAVMNVTYDFTVEADPITAKHIYGEFISSNGGRRPDAPVLMFSVLTISCVQSLYL